MRLGIDLDGVAYDFAASLRHWLVHHEGHDAERYPDPQTWDFYRDQWGMTLEEFTAHCDRGVDAGVIFVDGDPLPGTRDALRTLKRLGHTLHIVTNRSFGRRSMENTAWWLHKHDIPYDTLHFAADKTSVRVDAFIEDNADNYLALTAAGVAAFLWDRPWNRQLPAARRITRWGMFVHHIEGLAAGACADVHTPVAQGSATTPDTAPADDDTNPKDLIGVTKPQMHLVPRSAIIRIAQAMANGAEKYGPFNWRTKKVRATVYTSAAERHLAQWFDGEELAEDSGVPHLAHAAACLSILMDAQATGNLIDDRPPAGAASALIAELTVQP
jgi:hypothetical protein